MPSKKTKLQMLQEELGKEYRICTIDLERCLYRDFGNGFNVEISGVNSRRAGRLATLYMWYGTHSPSCIVVRTVREVERTATAIKSVADELCDYSQVLVSKGLDNRDKLFRMKYLEL